VQLRSRPTPTPKLRQKTHWLQSEGQQTHSQRRARVLRTGVFSQHREIMEIAHGFGLILVVRGRGPRHCHGLAGRCDKPLPWALSLLQARLFTSQTYGASSPHLTNPFLLEGAEREHEGLSLIPSDALQMIRNTNQMAVEGKVVGPGCSPLQRAG